MTEAVGKTEDAAIIMNTAKVTIAGIITVVEKAIVTTAIIMVRVVTVAAGPDDTADKLQNQGRRCKICLQRLP